MKTVCIYHSIDLDGWMSAAIVKKWFEEINDYPDNIDKGSLDFIGYDYGQPIPNLSKYNKVIMCDISFPVKEMEVLMLKYDINFTWIDHHISAIVDNTWTNDIPCTITGIRNSYFAACESTWQYFFPDEPMPEIVRLLGMYDSFRHKGTNEEQTVLEFQYGARSCMNNYEECYTYLKIASKGYNDADSDLLDILEVGYTIYKYLCTEAKQVYAKSFPITFAEPVIEKGTVDNTFIDRKFSCVNKERFNPINFGIDYHKDDYDGFACFYRTKDGKWAFSLYNDNGKVDCSVIAKQYGGGGHKGAAGFIIEDLNNIF